MNILLALNIYLNLFQVKIQKKLKFLKKNKVIFERSA